MFGLRLSNLALYRHRTRLIGMRTLGDINGKLVHAIDCVSDANPDHTETVWIFSSFSFFKHRTDSVLFFPYFFKLRFHTTWHVDVRNFEPPH